MLIKLSVSSNKKNDFIEITEIIQKLIKENNFNSGIITLFIPHTTAGITINENADPDVKKDMINFFNDLIPKDYNFSHIEGNSDGHIKSTLFNQSLSLIVENKELILGTWQGIYFCEFDGPKNRKVYIKFIEG